MKKSKPILFLMLFVFTVSTTGLPLFVHLCNTMQKVSLKSCPMCQMHKTAKGISISRVNNCCEGKVLITPNPEQYLSSKDHKEALHVYNLQAVIPDIIVIDQHNFVNSTSIFDSSPPGTISNSLYLNNSILLI